jgi:hypothetical protein
MFVTPLGDLQGSSHLQWLGVYFSIKKKEIYQLNAKCLKIENYFWRARGTESGKQIFEIVS